MPTSRIAGDERGVLDRPPVFPGLPGFAGKLIPLEDARDLYNRVRHAPQGFRLETLLAEMDVELDVHASDLGRIPTKGPLVAVANHPFGLLDGAALGVLLSRFRPDVKVLTNSLLDGIPELHEHCIFVDPFHTSTSADTNIRGLKHALEWLRQGGALAVFPAGEVSQWNLRQGQIADPAWSNLPVRLAGKTGASTLPVYFCGHNSVAFQVLGLINPRLRTLLLLQEFLQQRGRRLKVRVGTPIPAELVANMQSDEAATEYLRRRTYLLAHRGRKTLSLPARCAPCCPARRRNRSRRRCRRVLSSMTSRPCPPTDCSPRTPIFAVYAARAPELPHLLDELGRLREVTFRAAGEGTGRSRDLDQFDSYYWHLLLWNKQKPELAGAYRAGNTDEIIRRYGIKGSLHAYCFPLRRAVVPENWFGA